ncbi:MAG TPA: lipopolysaccharide biosynthesis protein [Croceibacterium sp.]|nr:lipopolysaccharide biosynthesis protein [Croceibacterium sp.]
MVTARNGLREQSPLARIVANTAWLLGGRSVGGILSLVYIAILTRSLGLKAFGHFSLIFGTSQALIAIAGFETWRMVVRYGAEHVHGEDWAAFGRLSLFAGFLDVAGAVFGTILAYIVFFHFSHLLHLNHQLIQTAFWFNVAAVWALVSAPTGIVRALDRFDVATYVEAVVPSGRLVAAVAIWLTGPSLARFLIAWAAIDLIEAALYWFMAKRLCPQAVRLAHLGGWRRALRENPRITRFFWVTYAGATLDALLKQGPLLAVGFFVGTKSAGLFRLARQLAQSLGKLAGMLTRAVYAEISRARVASQAHEFRRLAYRTTMFAGVGGLIVVLLAVLLGGTLMDVLGGDAFRGGGSLLVPLAIAASFELAAVAFEPVLHATGHPQYSLTARFVAVVAAAIALAAWVHPYGVHGIAWAVALGGAVGYLTLGALARYTLGQSDKSPPAVDPAL